MLILNLVKSPKYFYTAIALVFAFFMLLILYAGKQVYENERDKLFTGKVNELSITKANFESRLDRVAIEVRRVSNLMKQLGLIDSPQPTKIQNLINDILFDYNFLSIVIEDKDSSLTKIDSLAHSKKYTQTLSKKPEELMKYVIYDKEDINKLLINEDINLLHITRHLTNDIGHIEKTITFFFSPDLMLEQTPSNYAVLNRKGEIKWTHHNGSFPKDLNLPGINGQSPLIVNDTQAAFFFPLSAHNSGYIITELADTSALKSSLLLSTVVTSVAFSIFFSVLMLIIYIRNTQTGQLIDTQRATVVCLANLAEFKDNETADHLERTRHYGALLTSHLKKKKHPYSRIITKDYMENIGFASVLHDIGKVGVPDEILKKPAKLENDEFETIKQHTVFAKTILKELVEKHRINDTFFNLAYNIAAYHHEYWDGSGYPDGLKGEEIPLEARIFSVCDVYDALRSKRVYKEPYSHETSMEIINESSGTQFDPDIIEAFNQCADQFRHIHNTYEIFYNKISYDSFGNNRRELKMEWQPELSVGIDEIDTQHKMLISKINDLIKAILDGQGRENVITVLKFLESYVIEHFQCEEQIMRDLNHEYIEEHIEAHKAFHNNLKDILKTVGEKGVSHETMEIIEQDLITWLLRHIVEMDAKINQ